MTEWEDDINRYRKGEMTPEEEHALEKKALNDPFLAEALEGATMIQADEFSNDIKELNQRIERRSRRSNWFWPLRIAASVAFIAIAYILFISFYETVSPTQNTITLQSSESQQSINSADSGLAESPAVEHSVPSQKDDTKERSSTEFTESVNKDEEKPVASVPIQSKPDEFATRDADVEDENKVLDKKITESLIAEEKIAAVQQDARISKEESLKQETVARSLSLKPSGAVASRMIHGKVIYAEDGKPLAGANVLVKGTRQGTVTDSNGEYTLSTTVAEPTLVYSFIGFQSTEVKPKDKSEVNVSLQSDVSQLSEVVVTGYSPQPDGAHEPVIIMAEPVGGRKAYDKYLQNSLRYPAQALENKIKGKVTLQFTVRTDGSLDEFSILKGLGYGCDEEVIRLVKEGPQWKPTTEDEVAVESEVVVRVKFALPD